jgi:ATP-dependent Clp protease ATP-binding subunit ClpA
MANYNDAKDKIMSSLKNYFRPEFINRLDEIVVFDILSKEAIKDIVKIQVDIVSKRLADKDIRINLSKEVFDILAKDGYNPQYGARPLKRLIQTKILNPIASLIIGKKVLKGGVVSVSVDKLGEFNFDVKNPKKTISTDSFVVSENMVV